MMQAMTVVAIGVVAGVLRRFFGLAGGVLIVPALVLVLSMPQQIAVGTSLAAVLPPVGLSVRLKYYRHGHANFEWAGLLAMGLMVGAYPRRRRCGKHSGRRAALCVRRFPRNRRLEGF
jgi:uncharacterized protein